MQEGRERIGKLHNADGRNDGGESGEVGDSGPNDKGDGPVHRDDCYPNPLCPRLGQGWCSEELDGDVVVKYYVQMSVEETSTRAEDLVVPLTPILPYKAAAMSALTIASTLPTVCQAYGEMPR